MAELKGGGEGGGRREATGRSEGESAWRERREEGGSGEERGERQRRAQAAHHVSLTLNQRFLAVHHAGAGRVAEGLHSLGVHGHS